MKRKSNLKIKFIASLILLSPTLCSAVAQWGNGFIEFTHSTGDDTFEGVSSIGFYGNFTKKFSVVSYGGIQATLFRKPNDTGDESVVRIFAGQSIRGTVSPFFEIGSDAYGFLFLLGDTDNRSTCKNEQECKIDTYFRFGVRFNPSKDMSLGIYHENISFGDSHTHLTGEHDFTGASLGFNF